MNRLILTGIIMAMALLPATAWAQEAKIVSLDMERAMLESDYAKRQMTMFEVRADLKDIRDSIAKLQADLRDMNRQSNANGMTWSSEQRADFQRRYEEKVSTLQATNLQLQSAREAMRSDIERTLSPKMETAVQELIAEEGITMIAKSDALYFAADLHDITDKVVAKLNDLH